MSEPTDIRPHDGRFIKGRHHFAVRIYYEDTDFSGIVYHANYLRFLERARSDMLALLKMDQRAAFESGEGAYAITDLTIKYAQPARMSDELLVISRPIKLGGATVVIEQIIMRGDDLICKAEVKAAFLLSNGRPRRQPADWVSAFDQIMQEFESS